ncbi:MAG: hypothetical protein FJ029_02290 [Actinobacteria bacterium]|nr:hypothetical protein [Actinomycetota bacterium]
MIARALIGPGPARDDRRAAYRACLGLSAVTDWDGRGTPSVGLDAQAVVDAGDPSALPPQALTDVAAAGALLVVGAPLEHVLPLRLVYATPDVRAGPLATMVEALGGLGVRTMTKAVVLTDDGHLAPALFRACLALRFLGGPIERLAARRRTLGPAGDGLWAVGRHADGSIAYLEASAAYPAGTGLEIFQALGRDQVLEYDGRTRGNRVWHDGQWRPLPAHRISPYGLFVQWLAAATDPHIAHHNARVAGAVVLYHAVLAAADRPEAMAL